MGGAGLAVIVRSFLAALLVSAGAAVQLAGTAVAASESSGCIPRGTRDPTYQWDRLNIVKGDDGRERPTAKSFAKLKSNQTSQIVLDPARNVQVAFISGVTLEAPAETDDWTVVETQTCPPARWAGAMAYDPINDEIVLWGGTMSVAGPTNDTWIYDTTRRDWQKLENGSTELRQLRGRVEALRDELEELRWDLWKTLEWKTTGKQGAGPDSALAARLAQLQTDLASIEPLAGQVESAASGYEQTQAAGARKWLASAAAKLSKLGRGIERGTLDGLERDYRELVALRTDVLSAADSVRFAPPSRYFVALRHDASEDSLVLESTVERDWPDRWVYRLRERRWERTSPVPGSAVSPKVPDGEYVLRDAATVAELQRWQAETAAWAASLPPNTWMIAPAHGAGRPNAGRAWSSIVYDPDREQLYYRDGGHGSYHGSVTDHYDIRTGRWFRSDVAVVPDGRIMGTYFGWGRGYDYAPWAIHTYKWNLFYNPLNKHLQRRVFHSPDRVDGNVNDYDPDRGKWSERPAKLNLVGLVVPGVPDGVVSVHAWDRYSGIPSAVVGYETAGGFVKWDNTGPIPFHGGSADDDYTFVFDPPRRRVMYYGGQGEALGVYVLDLRASRPKWKRLDVSVQGGGRIPSAYREWIYISRHDVFLSMERQASGKKGPPKVWAFDPETNLFRRVALAIGPGLGSGEEGARRVPPADVSSGLAYDPVSDLAFFIRSGPKPPTLFAFRYVPGSQ